MSDFVLLVAGMLSKKSVAAFDIPVNVHRLNNVANIELLLEKNKYNLTGKGLIPGNKSSGLLAVKVPLQDLKTFPITTTLIIKGSDGIRTKSTRVRLTLEAPASQPSPSPNPLPTPDPSPKPAPKPDPVPKPTPLPEPTPTPAPEPAPKPPSDPAPGAPQYMFGVTTEALISRAPVNSYEVYDPEAWRRAEEYYNEKPGTTKEQINALKAFAKRPVTRVVFDRAESAISYKTELAKLAKVSDVMGCLLDSSAMTEIDNLSLVESRALEYTATLGDLVSIWEIGNEINGEWLDPKGSKELKAFAKSEVMYKVAKATGKPTAMTFYFGRELEPPFELFSWIEKFIPQDHSMRKDLDYVLVSYYENLDGNGPLSERDMDPMFEKLQTIFPNAKLGFGEFGWGEISENKPNSHAIPKSNAARASLIKRFYGYMPPASIKNYIGGGFYWHFHETMAPRTKPDWAVLNGIMKKK